VNVTISWVAFMYYLDDLGPKLRLVPEGFHGFP